MPLHRLEVPPAGYEWVRDGNDAMLIDTTSGEILQVEYGVFA
jgi:Ni/Co efflux regulator RcnB